MRKNKKNQESPKSMMSGRIMERIHAEHVVPISSSTFLWRNTLLGFAVGLSMLIGIFFASVTIFKLSSIHVFGKMFILGHLPWFSAGLAIACFLLTFALLEYYKVFYRFSVLTLFTSVALIFFVLGFLFTKTPIHTRLIQSRFAALYSVEEKPLMVYAGRALEVRTQNAFLLETLRGEKLHVYIPADTRLPEVGIKEGQSVFVAGYYQSGMFVVKGFLSLGKPQV